MEQDKESLNQADKETINDLFNLLNSERFSIMSEFIQDYRNNQSDYIGKSIFEYFLKHPRFDRRQIKTVETKLEAIKNLTGKLLHLAKLEHLAIQEKMQVCGSQIYKIIRNKNINADKYQCTGFVSSRNEYSIFFEDKKSNVTQEIEIKTSGRRIEKISFAIFDSKHLNLGTAKNEPGTTIWEKKSLSDKWEEVVKN